MKFSLTSMIVSAAVMAGVVTAYNPIGLPCATPGVVGCGQDAGFNSGNAFIYDCDWTGTIVFGAGCNCAGCCVTATNGAKQEQFLAVKHPPKGAFLHGQVKLHLTVIGTCLSIYKAVTYDEYCSNRNLVPCSFITDSMRYGKKALKVETVLQISRPGVAHHKMKTIRKSEVLDGIGNSEQAFNESHIVLVLVSSETQSSDTYQRNFVQRSTPVKNGPSHIYGKRR
ncbi:hypothetical protein DEU56DRAFT_760957 [Suillus clintonianus]|uniref:uncharacterized protein n=1 Tax=Suillus clintonianus TaxID=1904413 RepID=UPI001B86EF7C|nr:uncharacterized protein DEU56DRAFT_760957 [Suillus clintonianus]KAG2119440.1 hypothetical protein DEU56DRAFT_760957 [Suillus clintonianus]